MDSMKNYSASNKKKSLILVTIVVGSLLLMGLAAVTFLAATGQDLRQQASELPTYTKPPSGCGSAGLLFNNGVECYVCKNYSFVKTDTANCYAVPRDIVFGPTTKAMPTAYISVPPKLTETPPAGARKCTSTNAVINEGGVCSRCRADGYFVPTECLGANSGCGNSGALLDTGSGCYACKNGTYAPIDQSSCNALKSNSASNTMPIPKVTMKQGCMIVMGKEVCTTSQPTPRQVQVKIKFR
jgi:hypothetical protein